LDAHHSLSPATLPKDQSVAALKIFAHFLNFSKGSCGELRTQLYIARKLKLLNKPDFETSVAETKEISAMLEGLRRSMLAKTRPKLKRVRRRKLKA
jgi:hypothetical protein